MIRIFYYRQRPPDFLTAYLTGSASKMSIAESKALGYPGPVEYFFTDFIPFMLARNYGILGHRSFIFPTAILLHLLLLILMVLFAIFYFRDFSAKIIGFLSILVFYTIVLFFYIYDWELRLQFNHSFIQSRYMFSVIGIAYVFAAKILKSLPRKPLRIPALGVVLTSYFLTGPLTFILFYVSVFFDWVIL